MLTIGDFSGREGGPVKGFFDLSETPRVSLGIASAAVEVPHRRNQSRPY